MAKSIVEKCTFVQEWEFQGNKNYNFVVKFKNSDDRFVYVGKDKDNPKFIENQEVEYTVLDKKIKVFVGDKTFEYPKIEVAKQAFGGGGFSGGGGGQKRYPKTYNEYLNELAWQTQQHTINFLCHRINLDPLKDFQSYYDVFYKSAFDKLKKD